MINIPEEQTITHTYQIDRIQLQKIMETRGALGVKEVKLHGGIEGIAKKLDTSAITGLNVDVREFQRRIRAFGRNVIPKVKPATFMQLAFEAIQDPTLIILIVAAIISLGLSFVGDSHEDDKYNWIEGIAILFSVFVVVMVTAFNDYTKELQFRGLQNKLESEQKFSVIRESEISEVSTRNILVGDICVLNYGNVIPADGILVQSNGLKIDESTVTGESDHVFKNIDYDMILLSGTKVMEGNGKMLVLAVGIYSQQGQIYELLAGRNKDIIISSVNKDTEKANNRSLLQEKLLKLAVQIGYMGTTMALLTVVILTTRFFTSTYFDPNSSSWSSSYLQEFVKFVIIGISVLVVAVPEGLPLAVTISLAYSVKKMMSDNNLVRHLDACETMGNATTICSDKTGTLTTNRMTAVQLYITERLYSKIPYFIDINVPMAKLLIEGICVNTLYTSKILPSEIRGGLPEQIGNKTECALLGLVLDLQRDYERIRSKYPVENFVHSYPFNSIRKSMSTVIRTENGYYMYTKGAAEIVLEKCLYAFDNSGKQIKFEEQMKEKINNKIIIPMARNGLRSISLAYKIFEEEPNWVDEGSVIKDLTLIAIVGIEDPVRSEVPKAIAACQNAGIIVRMVTGDNINTARSIALKCGIISPNDGSLTLEGKQFNRLIRNEKNEVEQSLLDQIWPPLRVLARASPADKYILVKGIMESQISKEREVVAVTGDGTNDGPALKKADVGFAMGITGTDIAKEASDIIITDDNFSSIVKAVMWGRNVYDSISKFIQFQLTVNLVAVCTAFVGACLNNQSPLKAVQLLWVNIIMDTMASLALSTEVPTEKILSRKPYGRTKSIISSLMLKNIFGQSIFQLTVIFYLLFTKSTSISPLPPVDAEECERFTIIFNTLVLMTLCNEVNARKIHGELNVFSGILNNKLFLLIWFSSISIQVLIIQFGQLIFSTVSLTSSQWYWCLLFGVLPTAVHVIINMVPFENLVRNFKINLGQSSSDLDLIQIPNMEVERKESMLPDQRETSASFIESEIRWIRNTKRIKAQIRAVNAFKFIKNEFSTSSIEFNNKMNESSN